MEALLRAIRQGELMVITWYYTPPSDARQVKHNPKGPASSARTGDRDSRKSRASLSARNGLEMSAEPSIRFYHIAPEHEDGASTT